MTQAIVQPHWKEHVIEIQEQKEIRCPKCGWLLMKGELAPGSRIQLKCTRRGTQRCGDLVTFARL